MKARSLLLLTPLLLNAALLAQSAGPAMFNGFPPPRSISEGRFGPLLRTLDMNRDGTLSPEELRLAPIALTGFDLDEDGFLVRGEVSAASMANTRRAASFRRVGAPSQSPADAALMLVLDANQDGILQPIEIANATTSLLRLDTNGDGAVTPDELRAAAGVSQGGNA
jgi:hypothetical protein